MSMGKSRDLRSHGIVLKALGVRQKENEWHHPKPEVHHAPFMLELTEVETLVSEREDNSPCVNHAEFFHVALSG